MTLRRTLEKMLQVPIHITRGHELVGRRYHQGRLVEMVHPPHGVEWPGTVPPSAANERDQRFIIACNFVQTMTVTKKDSHWSLVVEHPSLDKPFTFQPWKGGMARIVQDAINNMHGFDDIKVVNPNGESRIPCEEALLICEAICLFFLECKDPYKRKYII